MKTNMLPLLDPAYFIPDAADDRWLPMNRVATTLCAQRSERRASTRDLMDFKAQGYKVSLPNGTPIETSIIA